MNEPTTNVSLTATIVARLESARTVAASAFSEPNEVGVRCCFIDDLLPEDVAQRIYECFPRPDQMRLLNSFRERKFTSKDLDAFDPLLKDITFTLQHPDVISAVTAITGMVQQVPDPSLYAGGLSMMTREHFLNPHIDNSHEASQQLYRTLNLLYYVTPGWDRESGGNLELWDRRVRRSVTVVSRFNRLVLMETNPWSWHSVSPVVRDGRRCCVSNYYFSPVSPTGTDYFNVTSFAGRPGKPVQRALAIADNRARSLVRRVVAGGLGRRDVYRGAAVAAAPIPGQRPMQADASDPAAER